MNEREYARFIVYIRFIYIYIWSLFGNIYNFSLKYDVKFIKLDCVRFIYGVIKRMPLYCD